MRRAVGRAERRLDRGRGDRDVAERFGREQDADARRDAAEFIRRGPLVAENGEGVVNERVIDEVYRHEASLYKMAGRAGQTG